MSPFCSKYLALCLIREMSTYKKAIAVIARTKTLHSAAIPWRDNMLMVLLEEKASKSSGTPNRRPEKLSQKSLKEIRLI